MAVKASYLPHHTISCSVSWCVLPLSAGCAPVFPSTNEVQPRMGKETFHEIRVSCSGARHSPVHAARHSTKLSDDKLTESQTKTGNKSEKYGSKRDHEVRAEQEIEWKKSKAVGKRKSVR